MTGKVICLQCAAKKKQCPRCSGNVTKTLKNRIVKLVARRKALSVHFFGIFVLAMDTECFIYVYLNPLTQEQL